MLSTTASPNQYCNALWPLNLPDVPFFLNIAAGLWEADDTLVPMMDEPAMALAVQAAADALRTGSDEPLNQWMSRYDPEWGHS